MKRKKNNSRYVTVKLEKKTVPILLGACHLGLRLQVWFYHLYYAITRDVNTQTRSWIENAQGTISRIRIMTGIKAVDIGLGEETKMISWIDDFVKAKCKEIEESSLNINL
jgi:hypothetical protein